MAGRILTSYVRSAGLPGPGRFIPTPSSPAWLPEGAVAYADFENGHYYANGAVADLSDVATAAPDVWGTFAESMVVADTGLVLGNSEGPVFNDALGSLVLSGFTVVARSTSVTSAIVLDWFDAPDMNEETTVFLTGIDEGPHVTAATFLPGSLSSSDDGGAVNNSVATETANTFAIGGGAGVVTELIFYAPVPDADLPALSALS